MSGKGRRQGRPAAALAACSLPATGLLQAACAVCTDLAHSRPGRPADRTHSSELCMQASLQELCLCAGCRPSGRQSRPTFRLTGPAVRWQALAVVAQLVHRCSCKTFVLYSRRSCERRAVRACSQCWHAERRVEPRRCSVGEIGRLHRKLGQASQMPELIIRHLCRDRR